MEMTMALEAMARRVQRTWRKHGWRLFGPLIVHNIRFYWKQYRTIGRAGMAKSEVDDIPGVETHRAVYLTALEFSGSSSEDANPYEPIVDADFLSVISALPVAPGDFTFVDIGSGKGRALFLAAKAGFKRVVGVEYSEDLHRAAMRNMSAALGKWPNVDRVELVCGDGAEYEFPGGPLVCYLYNPFGASVMSKVIRRLVDTTAASPADVWVVYGNPTQSKLFDAEPAFERAFVLCDHVAYRRRSS
jgi:SAM-dependent methyltransferase